MAVRWQLVLPGGQGMQHPAALSPDAAAMSRRPGSLPHSGELIAAVLPCIQRWLEVADVIVCPYPRHNPGEGPVADWLTAALDRLPGAAIATAEAAGACHIAARGHPVITLIDDGARPASVVAGCLAHAWLVAGQPFPALDGARFRPQLGPEPRNRAAQVGASWPFVYASCTISPTTTAATSLGCWHYPSVDHLRLLALTRGC
jgi:hypothetical protein